MWPKREYHVAGQNTQKSGSFALNQGPIMIACVGAMLAIFLVGSMNVWGSYLGMLPNVLKPTAWLAFALFIMAFTASSIQILFRGTCGRWAMKNRRYIGLSFALVHFVHAGLVLSNLVLTEESRTIGALTGGGLAYLFLLLMALTSNNAAVRKLGAKNWKRLHKVGSYYIWLIFVGRSLPNVPDSLPLGVLIPLVALTALGLRIAAHRKLKK